jgi:hypothetical protein
MTHPKTRAARISTNIEHDTEKDFFGMPKKADRYKPNIHNLIYCVSCRKEKLQFETRKEAYRYLEFNSDRIAEENGYAPNRAYWCDSCCCWHVTSKPKKRKTR